MCLTKLTEETVVSLLLHSISFISFAFQVCDRFGRPKYDNYLSAKRAAKEFQAAKGLAEKAFVAGGYGHWLKKPVEEQMFE